jgi:hypothetical protein
MKYNLSILIFLLSLVFTQCKKVSSSPISNELQNNKEEISSSLYSCSNQSNKANISICVDSLYDSRCPSNVVCVWGGESIAKIRLNVNNSVFNLKMSLKESFPEFPNDTTINGYRIKYINQVPYPIFGVNTNAVNKISHFTVSF